MAFQTKCDFQDIRKKHSELKKKHINEVNVTNLFQEIVILQDI